MNHYRLPGSKFGSWFYAISIFFLLGLSSLSAQIGLHVHQYKPPFSPLFFNRKSVPSPFYRSVSAQYPRYVIQKINLDPDKGIVSSGLYMQKAIPSCHSRKKGGTAALYLNRPKLKAKHSGGCSAGRP